MPYVVLKDFRGGLDRRRRQIAGLPGSLWELKNAVVTEGGDIERRKAIVPVYTLPNGTFGLSGNGGSLYAFGTDNEPAGMPRRVVYKKLTGTSLYSGGILRILDVDYFNGNSYVVALMGDGAVEHFYAGDLVTDWREAGLQPPVASKADVAAYMARYINSWSDFRSVVSGDTFTIEGAPNQNFTVVLNHADLSQALTQAHTAGTAEVRATATVAINSGSSGGTIDSMQLAGPSVSLIEAPVKWAGNTAATAVVLADAINAYREIHGCFATAASNVVTITAPVGAGAAANSYLPLTYATNISVADGTFSGGVTGVQGLSRIVTVTVGGTFGSGSNYWLTIDGQPFRIRASVDGALAKFIMVHRGFGYSAARTLLYRSAINDPTKWPKTGHAYTGATTIATGNASGLLTYITGLGSYLDDVAIFSAFGVQVWRMDPDPLKNSRLRFIPHTGTRSHRTILAWGNDDLIYLADNGIRSLQSADSSGRARMSDIGSPIDPLVQSAYAAATDQQREQACAVIDPVTGRLMVSIGKKIYVLSDFPASRVRAWSVWEVDFEIEYMTATNRRVYFRSGNTIYCYGGLGNNQWPAAGEAPVTLETPFYDAGTPGHKKMLKGFDAALQNEWQIRVMTDPDNRANYFNVGRVSGTTYNRRHIPVTGEASHFAIRAVCSEAGVASFSGAIVHYEGPPPPTVG